MKDTHYNCKSIRLVINEENLDFPSRVKLVEYISEVYGIGETTIRRIIKSNTAYKPRTHALKHLTGMRIYYI